MSLSITLDGCCTIADGLSDSQWARKGHLRSKYGAPADLGEGQLIERRKRIETEEDQQACVQLE